MSARRTSGALLVFVAALLCAPEGAVGGCQVHEDQEGPFYLPGAPFRDQGIVCLPEPSESLLTFTGRVLTSDCQTVVPNAVLDIWQASPLSPPPSIRVFDTPELEAASDTAYLTAVMTVS